jgi:riboflavin kinase/FMN adenylyltransferase
VLLDLAETFKFEVEEIPAQTLDAINVSSTKIRQALLGGQVSEAAKYLGRNYALQGTVVHGDKLGRQLGYPTANIELDYTYKLIPAFGVYAVNVFLEGEKLRGVMNLGIRPTTHHNSKVTIEVYILDFAKEVYGKQIEVEFVERLRDEKRFGSIDELKACIAQDVENAKNYV